MRRTEPINLTRAPYEVLQYQLNQIAVDHRNDNEPLATVFETMVSLHFGLSALLKHQFLIKGTQLPTGKGIVALSILPVMNNLDNAYRAILKGMTSTAIPLVRSVFELLTSVMYTLHGNPSDVELYMKHLTEQLTPAEEKIVKKYPYKWFGPAFIQKKLYGNDQTKYDKIREVYHLQSGVAHQIWKSSIELHEYDPSSITAALEAIVELMSWSLMIIIWNLEEFLDVDQLSQIADVVSAALEIVPETDLYPTNNMFTERITMIEVIQKLKRIKNRT